MGGPNNYQPITGGVTHILGHAEERAGVLQILTPRLDADHEILALLVHRRQPFTDLVGGRVHGMQEVVGRAHQAEYSVLCVLKTPKTTPLYR